MKTPDIATKRRLALEASVCEKTITKLLRGGAVRGLAGQRARAILEREGLLPVAEARPAAAGSDVAGELRATRAAVRTLLETVVAAGGKP